MKPVSQFKAPLKAAMMKAAILNGGQGHQTQF
jgi:hypothetical protein